MKWTLEIHGPSARRGSGHEVGLCNTWVYKSPTSPAYSPLHNLLTTFAKSQEPPSTGALCVPDRYGEANYWMLLYGTP